MKNIFKSKRFWQGAITAVLWASISIGMVVIAFGVFSFGVYHETRGNIESPPETPQESAQAIVGHNAEEIAPEVAKEKKVSQKRLDRAWQNDTSLFLKAILTQENGPDDNPYNFQPDFIEDVRIYSGNSREHFKKLNLADPYVAAMLVVMYGHRWKIETTHQMAAIFCKGPTDMVIPEAQAYADRVCNLVELYLSKGE